MPPAIPRIVTLWHQSFNQPVPPSYHDAIVAAENSYPWDWITAAFAEAQNAKYRWPYIRKVLQTWREAGQMPNAASAGPVPPPTSAPTPKPVGPQIYRTERPSRKATVS